MRDLWTLASTPARARRLRVNTVTRLLKRHRVRRLDAAAVLATLRGSAVVVAAGTHEAAVAHLEVVFAQFDVVAAQLARATREIDRLTARLTQSAVSPAHNRLQDAVYHWANAALQHDTASRTKYASLLDRDHGHARALRSVADRLLAVSRAMLERQRMFDPNPRSQAMAPDPLPIPQIQHPQSGDINPAQQPSTIGAWWGSPPAQIRTWTLIHPAPTSGV